jgi:hypothetical protein
MEPRRYRLVPDDTPRRPSPVRRRYSLARVAPSSRSALGVDRLERMEEIAQRGASVDPPRSVSAISSSGDFSFGTKPDFMPK